ncbi:MAG: AI-2E family transporter [Microbacteriaceae bacterium]|nr:AI-2E family transporter [Microbacteriaceae bacterium]
MPRGLRTAAGWSWRLLLIIGLVAAFVWLIITFRIIVIPFLIAILLAALLIPFSNLLQRHRWPRWLAILTSMLGALAIIGGLVTLVVFQIRGGWNQLVAATLTAVDQIGGWLAGPPFYLELEELRQAVMDWWEAFSADMSTIWSGALSVGSTATHVLAGLLLTLFATLFLLIDGPGIWRWALGLLPRGARPRLDDAAGAGWTTLTTFARVQVFVAFVDAVGIGLGAWILGLFYGGFPLIVPIAVVVFLASFIPIVGAFASGALAVFVALVYLGPIPAVIMLGIVLLVQQIEGHVLQPLIMGTAVKVHPLAVVFAVAAGSLIAGIPGALFAVPLVAVANTVIRRLAATAEPGAAGGVLPGRDGPIGDAQEAVPELGQDGREERPAGDSQ